MNVSVTVAANNMNMNNNSNNVNNTNFNNFNNFDRQTAEHRKLCRVSRGTKVPMGSTPPTLIAGMTALTLTASDPIRSYDNRNRKRLETVDSDDPCYSSDDNGCGAGGDNEHSNLSRNESTNSDSCCFTDNVGATAANNDLESEYNCKSLVTPHDSGYSSSIPLDAGDFSISFAGLTNDEYASLLDYTLKLGYSEAQLRTVLNRLSSSSSSPTASLNIGQNNLLAELIKLGQDVVVSGSGGNSSSGQLQVDSTFGGQSMCSLSPMSGSNQNLHFNNGASLGSECNAGTTFSNSNNCSSLRAVVIDGSNVAMTHGHKEVFSCKGIKECVEWFKKRGHTDMKVFVPQFRKEAPRNDSPITDQHLLFELEQEKILVWTPSRRLGGRRIICYDDRYIVKTAAEKDAVIVSNDEYRDVMKENPEFKKVIEERLLMYSFVDGKFMPPDDPLGRYGPPLAQFLRKGVINSSAPNCPYGRKCTYGNKCKYSHPERPGGGYKSVTDRLRDHADFHKRISPSNSLQSSSQSQQNADASGSKPTAFRSQSLNQQIILQQQPSPSTERQSPQGDSSRYPQHAQARRTLSSVPQHHFSQQQQRQHEQSSAHRHLSGHSSNPETTDVSSQHIQTDFSLPPPFCTNADGFLMPPSLHQIWQKQHNHQPVGRNLSAPGVNSGVSTTLNYSTSFNCSPPGAGILVNSPLIQQQQQRRKNSISDSQLNLVGQYQQQNPEISSHNSPSDDVFNVGEPSARNGSSPDSCWSNIWGPLENSSMPLFSPCGNSNSSWSHHAQVSRVNTLPMAKPTATASAGIVAGADNTQQQQQPGFGAFNAGNDEKRLKLFYHLSQLFPSEIVATVLSANPYELDAQKLCPMIIALQNNNAQQHQRFGNCHSAR